MRYGRASSAPSRRLCRRAGNDFEGFSRHSRAGPNGRLVTRLGSGETFEIGRILVWETGSHLVFTGRQTSFSPSQSTEVELRLEPIGEETRVSIEHRAWDTIPQCHAARHGFPEPVTLQRAADWWRASMEAFGERLAHRAWVVLETSLMVTE